MGFVERELILKIFGRRVYEGIIEDEIRRELVEVSSIIQETRKDIRRVAQKQIE